MRAIMRLSVCLLFYTLGLAGAAAATVPAHAMPPAAAGTECVRMAITTSESPRGGNRQHFRIMFENHCQTSQVLHWCAENRAQAIDATPACAMESGPRPAPAAPLFTIDRWLEFQWSFAPGTRIRFVACAEGRVPTADLRCDFPPAPRAGP